MLTPRKSSTWKLYGSHANPFVRVVHGVPMSWDTSITATTHPYKIEHAVWSPCNRFIAITWCSPGAVDILDSVTLQLLQTLRYDENSNVSYWVPAFSPDSCILTIVATGKVQDNSFWISWDLQTGGISSIGRPSSEGTYCGRGSIAYSVDGKMVGIHHYHKSGYYASIYDVASGALIHSPSLEVDQWHLDNLWAHGESFQFATMDKSSITIWEVGPPHIMVDTLPSPDFFCNHVQNAEIQLLLILHRVSIAYENKIFVWDAQNSKYLLQETDTRFTKKMSFSSDGCFFACQTTGSEIYLWKESPAGYILHNILLPSTPCSSEYKSSGLLFSKNGESIVAFDNHTIQLWHTKGSSAPPSSLMAQAPCSMRKSVLDFSPDGMLAVVAMQGDNVVKVLDLKSGVLNLTINASMKVYGLRVIGNTVVVIGDWNAQRFYLPTRDYVPNPRAGLEDSSWTVKLTPHPDVPVDWASISPDCNYIAFTAWNSVYIFSTSTGYKNAAWHFREDVTAWFADKDNVWYADNRGIAAIGTVGKSYITSDRVHPSPSPPAGYPWGSAHGYQVTDDWWILSPDRKRLLMLPPPWQSDPVRRIWKSQFLALLHHGLSEAVILELDP